MLSYGGQSADHRACPIVGSGGVLVETSGHGLSGQTATLAGNRSPDLNFGWQSKGGKYLGAARNEDAFGFLYID
jgi:hypothetical protein